MSLCYISRSCELGWGRGKQLLVSSSTYCDHAEFSVHGLTPTQQQLIDLNIYIIFHEYIYYIGHHGKVFVVYNFSEACSKTQHTCACPSNYCVQETWWAVTNSSLYTAPLLSFVLLHFWLYCGSRMILYHLIV